MLPKAKRIPRKLFGELLLSKRYANSPHFSLRVSPLQEGSSRFAVSVSKKVSKKASVRNTIRRRVYSVLRNLGPLAHPGLYLFIAKPGSDKIKGEMLSNEVAELLKKS